LQIIVPDSISALCQVKRGFADGTRLSQKQIGDRFKPDNNLPKEPVPATLKLITSIPTIAYINRNTFKNS